jgi:hypothetical protein
MFYVNYLTSCDYCLIKFNNLLASGEYIRELFKNLDKSTYLQTIFIYFLGIYLLGQEKLVDENTGQPKSHDAPFKGIVQQKLIRVEIGTNLQVLLYSVGALDIFFSFKEPASWISQKMFCRHLSPDYWYCRKELVER